MRTLIVNADDLGLSVGINESILTAVESGIVRSATAMVTMPAFEDAVSRVASRSDIGVGLHLNLTWGTPLSGRDAASLCRGSEFAGLNRLLIRSQSHPADLRSAAEAEALAQISALREAGIEPTHLDSHQHIHVLPGIADGVSAACRRQRLRRMRWPAEPHWARLPFRVSRGTATSLLLWFFATRCESRGLRRRSMTPRGCLGIARTGNLSADYLAAVGRAIPPGTWELCSHPGRASGYPRDAMRDSRENDLRALTDPRVHESLRNSDIHLADFSTLQGRQS